LSSAATEIERDGVLIETPENVAFTFTPAGIGARALAYLLDIVVRGTPFLVIVIVLSLTDTLLDIIHLGHVAIAFVTLGFFGIQWLYYLLFEYFWQGRTPGKRALGIRVVMDGGYPLTFVAAAVRNLMRFADFLPVLYAVGIVSTFVSRRSKRLGDFAAGTLVVREEPFDIRYLSVIEEASAPASETASARAPLSPQEIDLITKFIQRQKSFDDVTRYALAEKIVAGIRPKVEGASARLEDMYTGHDYVGYLELVLGLAEKAAPSRGDVGVNRFVKEHKEAWVQLAGFVERVDVAGLKSLGHSELRDVTRLYRQAAGDLAYSKTFFGRTGLTRFLNTLMGRAHNHIYRAPATAKTSVVAFFRTGFPLAFQRSYSYFALALYIFVASAILGAIAYAVDERTISLFMSPEAIEGVKQHRLWTHDIFSVTPSSVASATILTNNISVTIAAFAFGITAGVGTVYILALNGLMLGATMMFTSTHGMGYDLWSFVGGHGFIELFIIIVAGAAGLKVGHALLAPGDLSRGESLRVNAREAVLLVLGGAPVLVVAGIIEGFVSPQEGVPGWCKIIFGASLLLALVTYLAKPVANSPKSEGRKNLSHAGSAESAENRPEV
jgi:uncharacterized membrane protein SpoIIM required for sporulation/uncharacterized RDD family membrane protein YckC